MSEPTDRKEFNKYVLGFAFDDLGRIALIHKVKPKWQEGLWNGIGGKVEGNELDVEAMVREFREETGVITLPSMWHYFGAMKGPHFDVEMFKMKDVCIRNVATMEQERVALWPMHNLPTCIDNVQPLLTIANLVDHPQIILYYGATKLRW